MKKLAIFGTLFATPALAHVGDLASHAGAGFAAGMLHPLTGLDHVLAMVAVGLWAAMLGGRALWALPLGFVSAMMAGGIVGAMALPLLAVELMILASVVLLGAMVALAARLPLPVASALVAVFGLFHGYAHGLEGAGTSTYVWGFILATLGLHVAGLGLGLGLSAFSARPAIRIAGAGTLAAGLTLMLT